MRSVTRATVALSFTSSLEASPVFWICSMSQLQVFNIIFNALVRRLVDVINKHTDLMSCGLFWRK